MTENGINLSRTYPEVQKNLSSASQNVDPVCLPWPDPTTTPLNTVATLFQLGKEYPRQGLDAGI